MPKDNSIGPVYGLITVDRLPPSVKRAILSAGVADARSLKFSRTAAGWYVADSGGSSIAISPDGRTFFAELGWETGDGTRMTDDEMEQAGVS